MQKFTKYSFFASAIFFLAQNVLTAQNLPNACTAVCLDAVTSPVSLQTPQKIKGIAVCNMIPADTSAWWVFRPSGTSFNFSFSTTGCTCATGGIAGADVVVYTGTDCDNLTKIQCKNGVSGSFTLTNLTPCKRYWIQAGSTNTCQCNVKLTYAISQLFKTINPVTISGPKAVCRGASAIFSAAGTTPCVDDRVFRWSVAQGLASINDKGNSSAEFFFNKVGKVKICVEPNYAVCFPTVTKNCYEVDVIDVNDVNESLKLCAEDLPYDLDVKAMVKKANPSFNYEVTPPIYVIKEQPGTKKKIVINYTISGADCAEKINLNLEVSSNKKITLPSQLLVEGEQKNINGKLFSCADVQSLPINFAANSNNTCDSNFVISLQCVRVSPTIYPKVALLDCINKNVVLDASKSTTLPGALPTGKGSTGNRSYLWSNGATTPKITVAQAGTYAVTVSYTYKWLSPTGFVARKVSKVATALVIGSANGKPITPLPSASKNVSCNTDTILYYEPKLAGVSYSWSVTNGKILGKTTSDSVKVAWTGNSPKKLCVRLSAACGIGNDTCSIIPTSTVQPKTPQVIMDQCIATDKFRFAVAKQANIQHHWATQNGILSQAIGDTVIVTWTGSAGRSLCVKAVADCTISADTCVTHTAIRPENLGEFKTEKQLDFSSKIFELQIIPNPAQDYIEVLSNRVIEQYLIFDNTGRLILESAEAIIDVKFLEKGLYILKGINQNKEVKVLKFIKI